MSHQAKKIENTAQFLEQKILIDTNINNKYARKIVYKLFKNV